MLYLLIRRDLAREHFPSLHELALVHGFHPDPRAKVHELHHRKARWNMKRFTKACHLPLLYKQGDNRHVRHSRFPLLIYRQHSKKAESHSRKH